MALALAFVLSACSVERQGTHEHADVRSERDIIGGVVAASSSVASQVLPHTVYLQGETLQNGYVDAGGCSATLLDGGHALTAAHCVYNSSRQQAYTNNYLYFKSDATGLLVATGNYDPTYTRAVNQIYVHPSWVPTGSDTTIYPNDIAVVAFSGGLAPGYSPVTLVGAAAMGLLPQVPLYMAGYGETQANNANTARVLNVAMFQGSEGYDLPTNRLTLVSSNGTSVCFGDSGGPTFASFPNGTFAELGVASGAVCGSESVLTDVRPYLAWIGSIAPGVLTYSPPSPTPPPAPTDLLAVGTSNGITVSWSGGGGSTAGFKIGIAVGLSAPPCTSRVVGNAGLYSFSGLWSNTPYTVSVCAYDSAGLLSGSSVARAAFGVTGEPSIAGNWTNGQQQLGTIAQVGANLNFNIAGQASQGAFLSPSQITAYGLTGTLAAGNNTINWSNGIVWTRSPTAPNLTGYWENTAAGAFGSIAQSGAGLAFVMGGQPSTGYYASPSTVVAYGLTGTFNPSGTVINWSNGAVWTLAPAAANLAGYWVNSAAGTLGSIAQSGASLSFGMGDQASAGYFAGPSTIAGYGLTGTLNSSGTVINWSSGAVWTLAPAAPNLAGYWMNSSAGTLGSIAQSGTSLSLVMGGQASQGLMTSLSTVAGYGLTGTFNSNGTVINWSNGAVWSPAPAVANLTGTWTNTEGAYGSITQSGTALNFSILGQAAQGYFTGVYTIAGYGLTGSLNSAGNTIHWSNGEVWYLH